MAFFELQLCERTSEAIEEKKKEQKPQNHTQTKSDTTMASGEKQLEVKVVLLGDSGVGKTSIAVRYVQGLFAEDQPSTIGASFFTKRL